MEKSIQEAWNTFAEILDEAMNKLIPTDKANGNKKRRHQDFMDKKAFEMIKNKIRTWEKYLRPA